MVIPVTRIPPSCIRPFQLKFPTQQILRIEKNDKTGSTNDSNFHGRKINKVSFARKGFLVGNQARLDCGWEKLFPYESFLPASRGEIKHSQSYLRRCAP